MLTQERLLEDVADRARLPSDDALPVIKVTLASMSHWLQMPQRQRLRDAVPGPERDATVVTVPPAEGGMSEFLDEVGRHLDVPRERARHLAQVVLSHLSEADPDLTRELQDSLPREFAELFTAPVDFPERRYTATEAPAPLTQEELDTELRRRPDWTGDIHHLARTIALPEDRLRPLLDQVRRDMQAMNHHCEHQRTESGLTFVLRTSSVDAVTPLDLDLADRIDAAVSAVGSGGRPG